MTGIWGEATNQKVRVGPPHVTTPRAEADTAATPVAEEKGGG